MSDPLANMRRDQMRPIHACPPEGSGVTPCCQRTPFEVPRTHRMTTNPGLVTCTGIDSPPDSPLLRAILGVEG